ncbi:hypothetical protein F5I97DRAFT_1815476 [Phlebopus sp. FC_14]|nr:hypothetical protein F5I97DRAFT_1815476 [Phlebopus sp. FC_14]
MTLQTLPYDLLFNIAQHLDIDDVHSVEATCKALRSFTLTRPVYRPLAHALLCRSRPLPLPAFQRLADLSTQNLIKAVKRAHRFEKAWRVRAPRPARTPFFLSSESPPSSVGQQQWYTKISAPPNEEIDWLSPITSSYTLCATKSGRVVCWDVARDVCLAEPTRDKKWELWKCRVEFDERAVYFTMARVLKGSYDDDRVMEFVLMKLAFPPDVAEYRSPISSPSQTKPVFLPLTSFHTTGVVMNVFLLDPPRRLLSAFVWMASTNTIALYVLLDWAKDEYVFVDTGIGCLISSNWSCILHEDQIVIHCEEPEGASQHFYPLSVLRTFARPRKYNLVPPAGTTYCDVPPADADVGVRDSTSFDREHLPSISARLTRARAPNPYPFPPWYPESAHFVRQWWPTLPGVPRLSCTVVLLAAHDPDTHRTRFVLAQHYFRVPIVQDPTASTASSSSEGDTEDDDDDMLRIWYVSTPFEVVCVLDSTPDTDDDEETGDRPRPLVAVDFGHAVWVEYVGEPGGVFGGERTIYDPCRHRVPKCLRFVTFPPVVSAADGTQRVRAREQAEVRTLEIPDELDLDGVETINIDQSQGAVILSVKEGKIFILRYE